MADKDAQDEAHAVAKGVAEVPVILSNLALSNAIANDNLSQQNAVSNQQAMNQLQISVAGAAVNLFGAKQ